MNALPTRPGYSLKPKLSRARKNKRLIGYKALSEISGSPLIETLEKHAPDLIDYMDDLKVERAAVGTVGPAGLTDIDGQQPSGLTEAVNESSALMSLPWIKVPHNRNVANIVTEPVATWVESAEAKPLTPMAFEVEALERRKVVCASPVTDAVLRDMRPEQAETIGGAMVTAIETAITTAMFNPGGSGDAATPASLIAGIAPAADSPSERTSLASICDNFQGDFRSATWIMHPRTAAGFASADHSEIGPAGGRLLGLPVVTTRHMTSIGSPLAYATVLLDPTGVFMADDGLEVRTLRHASAAMSDSPTGDTSPPSAESETVVSMFQTNSVLLVVERHINWRVARTGTVSWLNNEQGWQS